MDFKSWLHAFRTGVAQEGPRKGMVTLPTPYQRKRRPKHPLRPIGGSLAVKRCPKPKRRAPTPWQEPLSDTIFGAPGRIRTRNLWVRSPALYPLSYRRNEGEMTDVLGRATGFEPVISCATDRRLRPLGYARHPAVPATGAYGSQRSRGQSNGRPQVCWPSYRSKKVGKLQEETALTAPRVCYN